MRRISFVIALSTLLLTSIVSAQQAPTTAVPNLIRYSWVLKDASPTSTAVGVTFAIYKQQEGGAPIWMETQMSPSAGMDSTAFCWEARQPQVCPTASFRSRKNAGWACSFRDKPSSRACCW